MACTALLIVALAAPTVAKSIAFDRLVTQTDTRVLAAQWLEARFPDGTTLYQTGEVYGYVEPRPADRYRFMVFDDRIHRFRSHSTKSLPDVIIVQESPMVIFGAAPRELAAILEANYKWVETFKGTVSAHIGTAIYDQQDAFYVPFENLDAVRRPGPDIRIFERR